MMASWPVLQTFHQNLEGYSVVVMSINMVATYINKQGGGVVSLFQLAVQLHWIKPRATYTQAKRTPWQTKFLGPVYKDKIVPTPSTGRYCVLQD